VKAALPLSRARAATRGGFVVAAVLLAVGAAPAPAGTVTAQRAAAPCDGQWQVVPTYDHSHLYGEIDQLDAVAALSPADEWSVGSWTQYPDEYVFHTLVEHRGGAAGDWVSVPSPNASALNSYLYGVDGARADDVWAVGGSDEAGPPYGSLVEHWDGGSWSIADRASFPGVLYGVAALGRDDVWAVGTEGYPGRVLIEHWDGSSWSARYRLVAGGFGGELRSVTAVAPDDIWAVGYYWGASDVEYTLAMHFDGRAWRRVRSPSPLTGFEEDQNWLGSVTATASSDVWAVGFYRGEAEADSFVTGHTLVEHWDGARWSVVASPDPGPTDGGNALWGVRSVSQDDVWAVGNAGGVLDTYPWTTPLVFHWDGSTWTQVGAPGSGSLFGLAAEPGRAGLSAVGAVDKPAQLEQNEYQGTLAQHLCPG
jgi:hypothetical protein